MRILFLAVFSFFICLEGALASSSKPLISVSELDTHNSLILEVSTSSEMASEHIPNAKLTHFFKDGWVKDYPGLPGMLPDPEDFNKTLSKFGLDEKDHIVLAACVNKLETIAATARIFWSLRVYGFKNISILDGGRQAYLKNSRAYSLHPRIPKKQTISALQKDPRWLTDYYGVYAGEDYGTPVIDARDFARARGEAPKHPLAQRTGKIFDAEIIPADLHVNLDDGTYKSAKAIMDLYEDVWGNPPGPIVLYSDTGLRAAISWFAIKELAGQSDVRLYDGGYLEWDFLGHEVLDETDDMGGPIGG